FARLRRCGSEINQAKRTLPVAESAQHFRPDRHSGGGGGNTHPRGVGAPPSPHGDAPPAREGGAPATAAAPPPRRARVARAGDSAVVANVLDVTADELIDERPDARGKDEAERGPRVAVEGELRRPRGLGVAGKRRVEPLRVAVERVLAAAEQITHALGGQRGA